MTGIMLVGLGAGAPDQLSVGATEILRSASEVWVSSNDEQVLTGVAKSAAIRVLDRSVRPTADAGEWSAAQLDLVIELGRRSEGVVVALAGHPLVDNTLGASEVGS